jgi:hypothetical protein
MGDIRDNIDKVLGKWLDDISLAEDGELETHREIIQHIVKERYCMIPHDVYGKMIKMRKHALESYGASNHIKIPTLENIDRALRHIHCACGTLSDVGSTPSYELIHSIFRIYMGIDGMMDNETSPEYEDWCDTKNLYKVNEKCNPNVTLFPSAVRRALIIINSDSDLEKLLFSINMNNIYEVLDACMELLIDCVNVKIDSYNKINYLLIVSALLMYASHVLDANKQ